MLGENVVLALGANVAGPWGDPRETLLRAVIAIGEIGVERIAVSPFYLTEPVGGIAQSRFIIDVYGTDIFAGCFVYFIF